MAPRGGDLEGASANRAGADVAALAVGCLMAACWWLESVTTTCLRLLSALFSLCQIIRDRLKPLQVGAHPARKIDHLAKLALSISIVYSSAAHGANH